MPGETYNTALIDENIVVVIFDLIQSDGWCHQYGILIFVNTPQFP
jgi:hypothetical protein